jgi:hypothetical protein
MMGDVIWSSDGGTVFPCVGHRILWTLDTFSEDRKVTISALVDDANVYGGEKSEGDKPIEK